MNDENQGFSPAKAARMGHAVATILNGAIKGGLSGAAIAAGEAFLPQLLRIIASILLLAILLPFFLFLSLVNPNFQFPSVEDTEIQELNQ